MDFVSDSLADGRSFRALAIVDHYTRECPVIEVDLSLPGARVVRVLGLIHGFTTSSPIAAARAERLGTGLHLRALVG